jgi:hypothetical protein
MVRIHFSTAWVADNVDPSRMFLHNDAVNVSLATCLTKVLTNGTNPVMLLQYSDGDPVSQALLASSMQSTSNFELQIQQGAISSSSSFEQLERNHSATYFCE